jgi:hypothetical protein
MNVASDDWACEAGRTVCSARAATSQPRDRLGLPASVVALVRPGGLDADITAHPSREAGPRRLGMDVATARTNHRRTPVRGGFGASRLTHE